MDTGRNVPPSPSNERRLLSPVKMWRPSARCGGSEEGERKSRTEWLKPTGGEHVENRRVSFRAPGRRRYVDLSPRYNVGWEERRPTSSYYLCGGAVEKTRLRSIDAVPVRTRNARAISSTCRVKTVRRRWLKNRALRLTLGTGGRRGPPNRRTFYHK